MTFLMTLSLYPTLYIDQLQLCIANIRNTKKVRNGFIFKDDYEL